MKQLQYRPVDPVQTWNESVHGSRYLSLMLVTADFGRRRKRCVLENLDQDNGVGRVLKVRTREGDLLAVRLC